MKNRHAPTESEVQFAIGCSPVCDVVRKPKRRKRKSRPWHRILGMLSALPLIWVLITGALLNHKEDFGLDETEIASPIVLAAYGMTPTGNPMSAVCAGKVITYWDGQVFFQDSAIELSGDFLGAVADGDGVAVVSSESVVRLGPEGEFIEVIDELSLPSLPLLGVARSEASVMVKNADGWHAADAEWLEFSHQSTLSLQPTDLQVLEDDELKKRIARSWSGGGVSLSRLVLDLHAGNFLGSFAKYFYDFVVICTLWLIGTGLILQYRTSRRNKPAR